MEKPVVRWKKEPEGSVLMQLPPKTGDAGAATTSKIELRFLPRQMTSAAKRS